MHDGFLRVASATPTIQVANCPYNAQQIIAVAKQAAEKQVSAIVFPELCLTGYTCGDLFFQQTLLTSALNGLETILKELKQEDIICIVGLPIRVETNLYNCAAVCYHGRLLGIVPKTNLVDQGGLNETRYFCTAPDYREIMLCNQTVPFGTNIIFSCDTLTEFQFGVEICKDIWVTEPPSNVLAKEGATVIFNLSASTEVVGRAAYRKTLVTGQSAKLICAYVYADAGEGESTTDYVYSGHDLIAKNGTILAESPLFYTGFIDADIDLQLLWQERCHTSCWNHVSTPSYQKVRFSLPIISLQLERTIQANPFLPPRLPDLPARCESILNIQANGLKNRLAHIGCRHVVIGLSGGLDSTLALLATVRAFEAMQLDPSGITAVSMPCFGTTNRTRLNARSLAIELGCTFREIDISASVTQHFHDIGQDPNQHDVTYENAQARERTQVLMDIANQLGGIVIGTGDLSESALGWATYNGDHMSMYSINCDIPKTMVRYLVAHCININVTPLSDILMDILQTPVSPELLPPVGETISQQTEEIVGPYELHDFVLFYTLRYGFMPHKIFRLACLALGDKYKKETIKHWMTVFYRRFFAQQFKRSCLPDGPAVGSVSLSPRGGWLMPSDVKSSIWLEDVEAISVES
mgnify:CR=1 FL=1